MEERWRALEISNKNLSPAIHTATTAPVSTQAHVVTPEDLSKSRESEDSCVFWIILVLFCKFHATHLLVPI